MLTGNGYSLVPRESRAARQFLYAEYCAERERRLEQQRREGQGMDESDSDVDGEWVPSARLLAGFPTMLRLPFLIIGTWDACTGVMSLTKRHAQGELTYRGSCTLLRRFVEQSTMDAEAMPSVDVDLTCEVAVAQLSFTRVAARGVAPPRQLPHSRSTTAALAAMALLRPAAAAGHESEEHSPYPEPGQAERSSQFSLDMHDSSLLAGEPSVSGRYGWPSHHHSPFASHQASGIYTPNPMMHVASR